MALTFPASPSNGATHTFAGVTYIYNTTSGWKSSGYSSDSDAFVTAYNSALGKGFDVSSGSSGSFSLAGGTLSLTARVPPNDANGDANSNFEIIWESNTITSDGASTINIDIAGNHFMRGSGSSGQNVGGTVYYGSSCGLWLQYDGSTDYIFTGIGWSSISSSTAGTDIFWSSNFNTETGYAAASVTAVSVPATLALANFPITGDFKLILGQSGRSGTSAPIGNTQTTFTGGMGFTGRTGGGTRSHSWTDDLELVITPINYNGTYIGDYS